MGRIARRCHRHFNPISALSGVAYSGLAHAQPSAIARWAASRVAYFRIFQNTLSDVNVPMHRLAAEHLGRSGFNLRNLRGQNDRQR